MMWLIILAVILVIAVVGVIYLTGAITRFSFIQKAAGGRKWRSRLLSLVLLAIGFGVVSALMSVTNAIVVLLHLIVLFVFAGLITRLLVSFRKKAFGFHFQGWLALVSTVAILGVGYYLCNHVWMTSYDFTSDKEGADVKVAVFSDSHIGTTFDGEGLKKHLDEIAKQEPDLLLIPGDFVDDWSNKKDMLAACKALGETDFPYGVWYAFGNHDEGHFGSRDFSADELREALTANGVHIMEDDCALIDNRFYVVGRKDVSQKPRKTMPELLEDVDRSKYIIVMDHQPNDYANEAGYADLVVSGHTHGGQLIPIGIIGKLIGAFDRAYGWENRAGTDFIVTSGISDWAILFKTGTKSEYLIINVTHTS
ncbi:MAG: metallophosphoesterase [Lachnospiraceae bacterium]|nr:metallophosphoesterase [Lachnospiraceae bacterium]